MKLKTIDIKDFGPHEAVHIDCDGSINGIVGANGKGKSHILKAIEYALTGVLDNQQQDYIRNFGAPDGAKSSTVKVEFEHNGVIGVISRTITASGSKRSLVWDGEVITQAKAVDSHMEAILGVNKAAIRNSVFIPQGAIADIVKGTPNDRIKLFQNLMNLSYINKRVVYLQEAIKRVKDDTPNILVALELGENALEEANITYRDAELEFAAKPSYEHEMKVLTRYTDMSSKVKAASDAVASAKVHYDEWDKVVKEQFDEKAITEAVEAYKADIEGCAKEKANAEKTIYELQNTVNVANAVQTLKDSYEGCRQEVVGLVGCSEDQDHDTIVALANEKLQSMQQSIEECSAAIEKANDAKSKDEKFAEAKATYMELKEKKKTAAAALKEHTDLAAEKLASVSKDAAAALNDVARAAVVQALGNATQDITCPVCGTEHVSIDSTAQEAAELAMRDWRSVNSTIKTIEANLSSQETLLKHEVDRVNTLFTESVTNLSIAGTFLSEALAGREESEVQADGIAASQRLGELTLAHNALVAKLPVFTSVKANLDKAAPAADADVEASKSRIVALRNSITELEEEITKDQKAYSEIQEQSKRMHAAVSKRDTFADLHATNSSSYNKLLEEYGDMQEVSTKAAAIIEEYGSTAGYAMEELQKGNAEYKAMESRVELLKKGVDDAEQHVEMLNKIKRDNDAKFQLISDLECIKKLLSKDGLIGAYMKNIFEIMTAIVNDMLSSAGANFEVEIDEDRLLTYKFSRTDNDDGYLMKQEALSGGQAVRLAFAMYIACHRIILPDVGLIVFDEPSCHLDEEGVDSLKEALQSLRESLGESDIQIILVDHNHSLTTACDTTTTL